MAQCQRLISTDFATRQGSFHIQQVKKSCIARAQAWLCSAPQLCASVHADGWKSTSTRSSWHTGTGFATWNATWSGSPGWTTRASWSGTWERHGECENDWDVWHQPRHSHVDAPLSSNSWHRGDSGYGPLEDANGNACHPATQEYDARVSLLQTSP